MIHLTDEVIFMTDEVLEKQAELDDKSSSKIKASRMPTFKILMVILLTYLLILSAIGYISFWDQDFNKPDNMVAPYVEMLKNYQLGETTITESEREEMAKIIQEVMKANVDNAGDLQELASHPFNIVLGVILSFLSGLVTMVFQNTRPQRDIR
jgi:flagellar basal body-associated protein FliL